MDLGQKKRLSSAKARRISLGDIISPRGKFKPINANGTVDRLRELRLVQIQERSRLAM